MSRFRRVSMAFLLITVFLATGCKGEPEIYTIGPDPIDQWFDKTLPAEGSLSFTHLPLDEDELQKVYPLGMNDGHIFPTDHIYLDYQSTSASVYAPAAGTVLHIEQPGDNPENPYSDNSIHVAITQDITYVLGHLHLDGDIMEGQLLDAGQFLGTTVNNSRLDLLVLDRSNGTNSLVNEKYPITTAYARSPFGYFLESLRDILLSVAIPPVPAKPMYDPDGPPLAEHEYAPSLIDEHADTYDEDAIPSNYHESARDSTFISHYQGLLPAFQVGEGTFEHDIDGALQGNWFKPDDTGRYEEGIAFSYDAWFPAQPRIRFADKRFAVKSDEAGTQDFKDVTAGETEAYAVYDANIINWHGVPWDAPDGLLKVQMISENRIKVEFFADRSDPDPPFTIDAHEYFR